MKFITDLLIVVIKSALSLITLVCLFNWFVSTPFGIHTLTYANAAGVMLIAGFFKKDLHIQLREIKTERTNYEKAGTLFALNLFILFTAYIIKVFFM